MAYAELCNQCVYGADLYVGTTTLVAKLRSIDVVLPIRSKIRQRTKSFDDVLACLWTGKPLQQFLQNQLGRDNCITAFNRLAQGRNFFRCRLAVSAKRKRPDADIDHQAHERERSFL